MGMTKTSATTAEMTADMTVQYKKVGKVRLIEMTSDNGYTQTWKAVPVSGPKKFLGVVSHFPFKKSEQITIYS
jgi:hypothetical protein